MKKQRREALVRDLIFSVLILMATIAFGVVVMSIIGCNEAANSAVTLGIVHETGINHKIINSCFIFWPYFFFF